MEFYSDESSIYDVPKPIFRFSSDFEDELPPPPPPVRQENIYCNYTNNNANKKGGGGGGSVRLTTPDIPRHLAVYTRNSFLTQGERGLPCVPL